MAHFARSGVEQARVVRKIPRERRYCVLNGGLKVKQVPSQKTRQAALDRFIPQTFLRASSMMVEPQPHAASMAVLRRDERFRRYIGGMG